MDEAWRKSLIEADRRHVWHPYTSSERHEKVVPLVIVRAEGAWLEDATGRRYLDGNASWWVSALGHGHPRIQNALLRQAKELLHCSLAGITHEPAVRLAEELVQAAPEGLTRVFFSDDGSTAVEVALKIAFQYWQQNGRPERTHFITLGEAFHGDTVGAVSLGGIEAFRAVFEPLLFKVERIPIGSHGSTQPDPPGAWEHAVGAIEALLDNARDRIAGVVIEPLVQGASGMRMWGPELLSRLRKATTRADTFLIADEVFTGFGRTGEMWACDHARVTPDLMCLAKGLSGGALPFAATLATERVYDGFRGDATRALLHGHSFCGNPLGAAVAREVLAVYREEHIVDQAKSKATLIRAAFEKLAKLDGVKTVRTLGMIGAADLGAGGYHGGLGWKVYDAALIRGAYLRPLGDTVYVTPPLTISEAELERLLHILTESVAHALSGAS